MNKLTIEDIAARLAGALDDSRVQLEPNNPSPLLLIPVDRLHEAALLLASDEKLRFESLCCLTGVQRAGGFEVMISLFSSLHALTVNVKVKLDGTEPVVSSVTDVWPAANWHEREAWDMFGIKFENHPDHRRILCPDDWEGFPLRKDYQPPEFYHDIPVTVNVPGKAVAVTVVKQEQ
jgi:NADH-quinone oxidoreductase subunit C